MLATSALRHLAAVLEAYWWPLEDAELAEEAKRPRKTGEVPRAPGEVPGWTGETSSQAATMSAASPSAAAAADAAAAASDPLAAAAAAAAPAMPHSALRRVKYKEAAGQRALCDLCATSIPSTHRWGQRTRVLAAAGCVYECSCGGTVAYLKA